MKMITRHFTVTGFVVHNDHTLLHWHPKVKAWLPPGGHIEENEDPVEAAIREIKEESGVDAEVVPTGLTLDLDYPTQVHAPFTIMIEDIDDPVQGFHKHIDMIYFCRLVGDAEPLNDGWQWVSKDAMESKTPLRTDGQQPKPPPEDVLLLAKHAFDLISRER